jgi:hypothetical protein
MLQKLSPPERLSKALERPPFIDRRVSAVCAIIELGNQGRSPQFFRVTSLSANQK